MGEITKEFLEEALGEEVLEFRTTAQLTPDDHRKNILYAVEVRLKKSEDITRHYSVKCFPRDGGKEEGMQAPSNSFRREYLVYHTFIPELKKFQRNTRNIYSNPGKHHVIKHPFTDLIFGRTVDHSSQTQSEQPKSLQNMVLMPDLRLKGFRIADCLEGFDLNHCKVVIEAQARFHALSWAYKQLNNAEKLSDRFPFLLGTCLDDVLEDLMTPMLKTNLNLFRAAVDQKINQELVKKSMLKSLDHFLDKSVDIATLYFSDRRVLSNPDVNKDNILRLPQQHVEEEQPWLVATHGDCWLNNIMFRYDEDTGKPVEVVFIDLQYTRENDPCSDLASFIYTSTSVTTRQAYLDELLQLYILTFIRICERFKVVPLPGFQLSELKRRFHRAKPFGMFMAVIKFPFLLLDKEKSQGTLSLNYDAVGFSSKCDARSSIGNDTVFQQRAVDLVRELWQEGVI